MTPPDDEILVERLSQNDTKAFDLLHFRYSATLFNFGLKYLKSREETEELLQSVFLKIWENRHCLRKDLSFRSYIFTILYNDICKIFRKKTNLEKYLREVMYINNSYTTDGEERIDNMSTLERINQIIGRLPERHRTIFIKNRLHGKTPEEIAGELGLTRGTVDNYISGALKRVRKSLVKEKIY